MLVGSRTYWKSLQSPQGLGLCQRAIDYAELEEAEGGDLQVSKRTRIFFKEAFSWSIPNRKWRQRTTLCSKWVGQINALENKPTCSLKSQFACGLILGEITVAVKEGLNVPSPVFFRYPIPNHKLGF